MTMSMGSRQRFTRANPCPICHGYDSMKRGQGKRCFGFLSSDGMWCHCSREEYAGEIARNTGSNAFAHKMHGPCRCGVQHGEDMPGLVIEMTSKLKSNSTTYPVSQNGKNPKIAEKPQRINYNQLTDDLISEYYDYISQYGEIVFRVVRYDLGDGEKTFRQWRPDGQGGWIKNLDGVTPILYRLPELLTAPKDELIFIVEGEKDVNTLFELGAIATCNPMGAKKWKAEYSQYLKGRHIIIIPDNDKDGRDHKDIIIEQTLLLAASIRVVNLPGAKEKGDITDWLNDGHTTDELSALIEQAEVMEKPKPDMFPMLTIEELAALPKPTWLVEPVLVRGYLTCIFGPTQTAKSFLALHYALTVAEMGLKVVYVIAENANGYSARIDAWMKYHNKRPNPNIRFIPMPIRMLAMDQVMKLELSIDYTMSDEPPALIIFDTLSRCFNGGNENETQDMQTFVNACDQIRRKYNSTVLVVHHTSRAGGAPRGSIVLPDDFDTVIENSKKNENGKKLITVSCYKQKDAKEFDTTTYRLHYDEETHYDFSSSCVLVEDNLEVTTDSGAVIRLSEMAINILHTLNLSAIEDEGGAGPTKLMELIGIDHKANPSDKTTFYNTLSDLKNRGLVFKDDTKKRPVYQITISGRDVIEPGDLM
jgi:predicted transcriptional regulator